MYYVRSIYVLCPRGYYYHYKGLILSTQPKLKVQNTFIWLPDRHIDASNCVKSVHIRNYSSPYFPAFGLNTERCSKDVRIQSEYWKKTDHNNSEYGHFSGSVGQSKFKSCGKNFAKLTNWLCLKMQFRINWS